MKIKNILLSLAVVAFISPANAQRYASDASNDGFRGPVKEVMQTMYEAKVSMGEMQRGYVMERLQTVYNSKGQRRSMTYLNTEDSIIFRTRYKHDGFGLITLEHIVDNHEHVVGRTYYVYDANNVLSEVYVEDEERQVENRMLLKYDAMGRVIQRSYNDPFNEIYKREVYSYDGRGNIAKSVVYDRQKTKIQEWRFEYDEHNQPVSQTLYDYTEAEPEVFFTLFKYQYDTQGNWIQKVEYVLENEQMIPEYITERKISY